MPKGPMKQLLEYAAGVPITTNVTPVLRDTEKCVAMFVAKNTENKRPCRDMVLPVSWADAGCYSIQVRQPDGQPQELWVHDKLTGEEAQVESPYLADVGDLRGAYLDQNWSRGGALVVCPDSSLRLMVPMIFAGAKGVEQVKLQRGFSGGCLAEATGLASAVTSQGTPTAAEALAASMALKREASQANVAEDVKRQKTQEYDDEDEVAPPPPPEGQAMREEAVALVGALGRAACNP